MSSRWSRCAVAVVFLLGGCSGESEAPPPVATLQSAGAPASSAPAGGQDQRPVLPLDRNDGDFEAAAQPWIACLVKEGGPEYKTKWQLYERGDITKQYPDMGKKGLYDKCLSRMPEDFESHQRRTDLPTYRDNQRKWYQCAKAAGYPLTTPDPETGEFGLTKVGPLGDAGSPKFLECRRKAYTG
jgi:hypothetical protein